MTIRTFHHVPLYNALDWLRCGWIVTKANCETHHDIYSVTMEWLCSCPMPRPK
jgi:hypothetical protein